MMTNPLRTFFIKTALSLKKLYFTEAQNAPACFPGVLWYSKQSNYFLRKPGFTVDSYISWKFNISSELKVQSAKFKNIIIVT
jgi:hypothetical protein